jgi:hypothetical protein
MISILRGAKYVTGNLRRSEDIAQEGSMNEGELSKDVKGRWRGVLLDEKTLPAACILMKVTCNL